MTLTWMLKGLVRTWCEEYNIKLGVIIFDDFADLAPGTMGICRKCNDGICRIYLNKKWLELGRVPEFLMRSVLWHEYCHGEDFETNGDGKHDSDFNRLRARKPLYHYGDYIAKFMWGIWRLMYKW